MAVITFDYPEEPDYKECHCAATCWCECACGAWEVETDSICFSCGYGLEEWVDDEED